MEISEAKKREYIRRLLISRTRLLCENGFFGLLLMHMTFALDGEVSTAATDGKKIYFSPAFMDELTDRELDFILMHEVMHAALRHVKRGKDLQARRYNIACDIVVNSNVAHAAGDDLSVITLHKYGVSMHLAPDGKEGYLYTAEEVYAMLPPDPPDKGNASFGSSGDGKKGGASGNGANAGGDTTGGSGSAGKGKKKDVGGDWDDHNKWEEETGSEQEEEEEQEWAERMKQAAEAIEIRDPSDTRGLIPAFYKRLLKEWRKAQTDWRTLLNDFLQEDVTDYSFSPPDRRYDDSPFFLPDFSDADCAVKNVLFMIDTSASMSDDMITAAYSEILGAVQQFNGRLEGKLGFFDAAITEPQPFCDEEELKIIHPYGGGGTSFDAIFRYVRKLRPDEIPVAIVILTDGYAPFPDEEDTLGIPVLWILNNEEVTPPWGKIARITV